MLNATEKLNFIAELLADETLTAEQYIESVNGIIDKNCYKLVSYDYLHKFMTSNDCEHSPCVAISIELACGFDVPNDAINYYFGTEL